MADSIPLQLAETIQTAHLRHNPSAERDLAPSTAADTRIPVVLETPAEARRRRRHEDPLHLGSLDDDDDGDDDDGDDGDGGVDSRYSVIRPWDPAVDPAHHGHHPFGLGKPRQPAAAAAVGRPHHQLPPLPDLRFEQSYLRSLAAADTWWKVGLVTARDQVLMPFAQGLLYNLAVCGWQYWNRTATLSGQSVGARVRRWWYGVNNWAIPGTAELTAVASAAKRPLRR